LIRWLIIGWLIGWLVGWLVDVIDLVVRWLID
jgi:uncharacterized membrane protein YeaQ/YmgE (transglycosylase-associated protein family)